MNVKLNHLVYLFFLALTSCASFSYIQDGKSLGKDNYAFQGNVSSMNKSAYNYLYQENSDEIKEYIPDVNLAFDLGVSKSTDFGMEINSTLYTGLRLKHQFIGSENSLINASLGFRVGTNILELFIAFARLNLQTPLFLSFHPTKNLCLYTVHSFNHQIVYQFENQTTDFVPNYRSKYSTLSNTLGLIYGNRHQFGVELTSLKYIYSPFILSIGYRYIFKY